MPVRHALLVLSFASISLPPAQAREPEKPVREAALPEGARARLGSLRFWDGTQITAVALSPNDKLIATAGNLSRPLPKGHDRAAEVSQQRITLWDAASGRKLRDIPTPDRPIRGLEFSPDGKILAAGCGEVLHLWDVASGKQLHELKGHSLDIHSVRFFDGGKRLATEEKDGTTHLWDLAEAKQLRILSPRKIRTVLLKRTREASVFWQQGTASPDGKQMAWRLAKRESSALFALLDVATGKQLHEMDDPEKDCWAMAYSPDGKLLATGFNRIILWDTATGKRLRELRDFPASVTSFRFSPDGQTLISSHFLGGLRLWDVRTGKQRCHIPMPDNSWNEPIPLTLSSDGRTLAASDGTRVRLFDTATGKELRPGTGHQEPVKRVHFSTDGRTLTSWSERTVRHWGTVSWLERNCLDLSAFQFRDIQSPDGQFFIRRNREGIPQLREMATGKLVRSMEGKHKNLLGGGIFSPDGTRILLADDDRGKDDHVVVYDVITGKTVGRLSVSDADSFELDPGGNVLAVADSTGPIRLLDMTTGKVRRSIQDRAADVKSQPWKEEGSLIFSPDGRFLAQAAVLNINGLIRVWNVQTERKIAEILLSPLRNDAVPITALAFSADGRVLASGHQEDKSIRLWEIATGEERGRLTGHRATVQSLAFSPDGTLLASGSDDGTVLVWNRDIIWRGNQSRPAGSEMTTLQKLWDHLGDLQAGPATDAMATLITSPERSVSFLKQHLRPVRAIDPQLFADLNSERFAVREHASRKLEALGEAVEPALREILRDHPTLEVRRRVERILERLEETTLPPELLREIRALEALERIATPEARELLRVLTRGAPDARLTQGARAALQRLDRSR